METASPAARRAPGGGPRCRDGARGGGSDRRYPADRVRSETVLPVGWVCFFCEGVNPPEADDCFYQPPGGPFEGARCNGKRAAGHWLPDDNIQPWSAPEAWRRAWPRDRLEDYEANITDSDCRDDNRIAEVFTSRMQEIAARKASKAERKREAMVAINASLLLAGWLCPGCEHWNLSFRDLCFRCNGKRSAAGVLSRGIPDPRRLGGDRDESDSDDSVKLHVQQEEQERLEATMKPFLRSTRSKRGSGARKRTHPAGGGSSGSAKGKKGKGRAGAAAWLGVGVVAATCRGTDLVRGPALPSSFVALPLRPVGRTAPCRFVALHRFAAFGRSRFGFVAGTARAAASYTWALARRVLNRLAHICTGNISAWAGVAAAMAAPVLFSIQRGSVGVVDDTLAAVVQQSADLIHEVGTEAARTVQVAGRALSVITLILCAAATWFVARAVLNRLVHALKGNTLPATLVELVGGEATFAVKGKRNQALHKVWVRIDSGQSACGCRAYLQEGACGHCDAAVQAAVRMGLYRISLR